MGRLIDFDLLKNTLEDVRNAAESDDIDFKHAMTVAVEIAADVLHETGEKEDSKRCISCKEFHYGYCYHNKVIETFEPELDNYRVSETGKLMETIKEAIDNYQGKNKSDQMRSFLYGNYKMSDKRIDQITKEHNRIIEEDIFPELAEEIESFVNNLYQLYEENELAEISRKTDAIKVDPDFSCRYWE